MNYSECNVVPLESIENLPTFKQEDFLWSPQSARPIIAVVCATKKDEDRLRTKLYTERHFNNYIKFVKEPIDVIGENVFAAIFSKEVPDNASITDYVINRMRARTGNTIISIGN